jgi:superkiller protein 3
MFFFYPLHLELTDLVRNDATKCAEFLQKYIDLQHRYGGRKEVSVIADCRLLICCVVFLISSQQIAALGLLLESSTFYSVLSTLPEPEPSAPASTTTFAVQQAIYNSLPILEQLVDLNETEELDFLKREVEKRRTRLGAPPLERLKLEVGLEVWEVSPVRLL